MAIINCPECGKEISNKAATCPNCDCPISETSENKNPLSDIVSNQIQQPQEEYIACPYCNSRELHAEQKGFSGGKALAGAVLLGGVGLLAGTLGSKDVRITCLKCGKSFKAGEAKVVKPQPLHNPVELDGMDSRVVELLKSGMILAAVKMYKEVYGVDLKEAKEKVEAFRDTHTSLIGVTQTVPSKNSGCMIAIITLVVIASLPLLLLI